MKFPLLLLLACYSQIVVSQNLLEYEVFEFSPKNDTILITEFGTKISINKNSFEYISDSINIKETIVIKVKEIVDKQDMILEGISTRSEDGILVSNGMILIEAYLSNSAIELKVNESIKIEVPASSGLTNMSVYEMNNSSINWGKTNTKIDLDTCETYKERILTRNKTVSKSVYKQWKKETKPTIKTDRLFGGKSITIGTTPQNSFNIPIPIDTIWACDDYELSQYSFNIASLGWYNIDKLRYVNAPINLIVSTDEDLDIYLLLMNENICIRAPKTKVGKYLLRRIPSRTNARIIGYRQNGTNDVNMVIQDIYLLKGEVKLKPSRKVTMGEFKRIIKLNK